MEGYKEIAASLRSSQRQDKLAGRRHCERQRGNLVSNTVMPPLLQKLLAPDIPFRDFRVFRGSFSTSFPFIFRKKHEITNSSLQKREACAQASPRNQGFIFLQTSVPAAPSVRPFPNEPPRPRQERPAPRGTHLRQKTRSPAPLPRRPQCLASSLRPLSHPKNLRRKAAAALHAVSPTLLPLSCKNILSLL